MKSTLFIKIMAYGSAAYGVVSAIVSAMALALLQREEVKDPTRAVIMVAVALGIAITLVSAAAGFLRAPGRKNALGVGMAFSFVLSMLLGVVSRWMDMQQHVGPVLILLCLGAGLAFYRLLLRPFVCRAFPQEKQTPDGRD